MKTCENCSFFRPTSSSGGFCHLDPPRTAATFVEEGESYSAPGVRLELEPDGTEVQTNFPACRFLRRGQRMTADETLKRAIQALKVRVYEYELEADREALVMLEQARKRLRQMLSEPTMPTNLKE